MSMTLTPLARSRTSRTSSPSPHYSIRASVELLPFLRTLIHHGRMAGRASPVTVRSKHPSHDDRDSASDDEAGKGHGRKAAASVAARFTPSIYHPRHQQHTHHAHFNEKSRPPSAIDHAESPSGFSADIAWRASISESRRATPAAYRPRPGSPPRRRASMHYDQQPSGDDSTDMQLPHGHKSTHSSILIGSPIVIRKRAEVLSDYGQDAEERWRVPSSQAHAQAECSRLHRHHCTFHPSTRIASRGIPSVQGVLHRHAHLDR